MDKMEDEDSSDDERRNPRSRRPKDDPKRRPARRYEDGGREPDSNDRSEPRMAGDRTPPEPTGAERETERADGEPLRAGDGTPSEPTGAERETERADGEPLRAGDVAPPMPRAAEIEEELEDGEFSPEEMERALDGGGESLMALDGGGESLIALDGDGEPLRAGDGGGESLMALDGDGEPLMALDSDEPLRALHGGGEPLRAGDGGGEPLRPTAADKGKEMVKDDSEEEGLRARPLEIPSSGPGNSNREVLVSDQQLEELKSHLKSRLGNHRENKSDMKSEVYLAELARDLSIYLLGSSKSAILPAKPKIRADEVQEFRCGQDVVTNHYVIHTLPEGEKLELYQVSWPDKLRESSDNLNNKKLAYWKNIFKDNLREWDHHFGIRMYDGGRFVVLNLHPNGRPSCLSTTSPNRFPIRNIQSDAPDDLGNLIIVYQGPIDLDDFKRFRDRNENAMFPQNNVDVVSIIMKQYCRDREYIESGRFYFEKDGGQPITPILTKRMGYFQSVRLLDIGLALNVDVVGTAFYKPGLNLVDVWDGLVTKWGQSPRMLPDVKADMFNKQNLPRHTRLSREQVRIVNDYWRNLKIEVTVKSDLNHTKKKYTIDEVTNTSATVQTIREIATDRQTNLIEFMGRHYNWPRGDSWNELPAIRLLIAKKAKPGKTPVELFVPWGCCFTSEASRVAGVMPSLLKLMDTKVDERYQNISKWINKRYENSSYPAAEEHFKVRPDSRMLVVMPLALNRPQLELGRSNDQLWDSTGRTARPVHSSLFYGPEKSFTNPARIKNWSIISFDLPTNRAKEEIFVNDLLAAANKKGMSWDANTRFPSAASSNGIIRYNPPQEWPRERLLGDLKLLTDAAANENQPLDLILCFMNRKMAMEYSAVKFFLDRQAGVPSQVVLLSPRKMNNNSLDNLLLKINVKCGGTNFRIAQVQDMALLQDTILMGLDVTHPRLGAKDTKFSIVALVATIDQSGVDYACRLKAQPSGQELTDSESMKTMVTELLNVYKRNVGQYPERILLFRDGLGESQVFSNLRFEGTAILRAARALQRDDNRTYEPKLAMILSIKRHHTRFFAVKSALANQTEPPYETAAKRQRTGPSTSQARGNRNDPTTNYIAENIQAGTVVYDSVTHPVEFDFYLCSQASGLGTSRPMKYHVVLDQISVGQLELYQTINTLCHTFQRSSKAVSLVTPVTYAHLAAARASLYLDQEIENARDALNYQTLDLNAHIKLKDRLWFL